MPLQQVTINGHEVAYHTSGTGPVLLLVHGMAGSSATWAHVTPVLSERFTVVAPAWGARDPFIPVRHARAAHATVPGSRLEIFEEVGHYPHCEAPARFVRVLLEFIDSTAPARVSERQWRELFQPPREVELSGSRSH